MKKLTLLTAGAAMTIAILNANATQPFAGKWGYWEDNCSYEIELDLYGKTTDNNHGYYNDFCDGSSMSFVITDVITLQGNTAQVMVDDYNTTKAAMLIYDEISGNLTISHPDFAPITFKDKDKFGYVFINMGDNVNVRATPISGTPLMKARRGSSFRFLGKEKGWFKIQLPDGKGAGYVSPEYAFYLKNNLIPEEAFNYGYSNGLTSIMLSKKDDNVVLVQTTMRPQQDGSFLPAIVETYSGRIEGNALIFTHWQNGYSENPDTATMSAIKPYAAYYWHESGMFIINGENFSRE